MSLLPYATQAIVCVCFALHIQVIIIITIIMLSLTLSPCTTLFTTVCCVYGPSHTQPTPIPKKHIILHAQHRSTMTQFHWCIVTVWHQTSKIEFKRVARNIVFLVYYLVCFFFVIVFASLYRRVFFFQRFIEFHLCELQHR